jgi:hypothetical protein
MTGTATEHRRADAGTVRLGQRDIDGLILCAEHSGAPYDLLAAGLRVEPARLRAITGPDRRTWLTQTLAELGHHAWAELAGVGRGLGCRNV